MVLLNFLEFLGLKVVREVVHLVVVEKTKNVDEVLVFVVALL